MLKLSRYILIISSLLIFNQKIDAQQAEANAGRNGIFVRFGNQLPRDFNYLLERKENTAWKTVYVSNFPKNITQLKNHLWSISGKNSFFRLPDSTEIVFLYNQITKYQSVDSIAIL
ncbi:MAG: hypothetical protein HC831_03645 [Chloroflexia bacterium]|nr:hypothetical protein [Chloroflexia bacterium]